MTYLEALEFKNSNQSLRGSTTSSGFVMDEIIIVPSDTAVRERFFQSYLLYGNDEIALEPFKNLDLEVWGINKNYLIENNVLFYKKLSANV